jgi:hypothetical protein
VHKAVGDFPCIGVELVAEVFCIAPRASVLNDRFPKIDGGLLRPSIKRFRIFGCFLLFVLDHRCRSCRFASVGIPLSRPLDTFKLLGTIEAADAADRSSKVKASAGGVAQQSFRFRPPRCAVCEAGRVSLPGSSADMLVGKVQIGAIHNKTCAQKERATSTAAPTVS